MKIFISSVLAILVAALVISPARAQIIEKKTLNLDGAKKTIAAAVQRKTKRRAG